MGRGGSALRIPGGVPVDSQLPAEALAGLWYGPQGNSAPPQPWGCAGVGEWTQLRAVRWVLGQAELGREGGQQQPGTWPEWEWVRTPVPGAEPMA